MSNICVITINWDAVSAIGSWLGAMATFVAAFIALYPYFKKGKLYFTIHSNIEQCPVLNIINNKPEGMLIEKICFFAGPAIFKKCFFIDDFLECEDDLVSDKANNFIEPYSQKKVNYESTRIIYDIVHGELKIKKFIQRNVRIVVYTNVGKIKINTKIKTEHFIEHIITLSEAYNYWDTKEFIEHFTS